MKAVEALQIAIGAFGIDGDVQVIGLRDGSYIDFAKQELYEASEDKRYKFRLNDKNEVEIEGSENE